MGSHLYRRIAAAAEEGAGGTIRVGVDPGNDPDGSCVAHALLEAPGSGGLKGTGPSSMVVLHVEAAAEASAAAGLEGPGGPSGRHSDASSSGEGEGEGEEEELLQLEAAALRRAVAAAGECSSSAAATAASRGKPPRPSNSSHIITLQVDGAKAAAAQQQQQQQQLHGRPSNADSEASLMSRQSSLPEGELCTICFERPASCVFLECGHGGVCKRCGYLLFVRPPNECPHCRQRIEQVLVVCRSAKVGELAKVK